MLGRGVAPTFLLSSFDSWGQSTHLKSEIYSRAHSLPAAPAPLAERGGGVFCVTRAVHPPLDFYRSSSLMVAKKCPAHDLICGVRTPHRTFRSSSSHLIAPPLHSPLYYFEASNVCSTTRRDEGCNHRSGITQRTCALLSIAN